MLLYITEEGLPHRVTLVYSNRDKASTAFLDELTELESQIPGLELVVTMTDDPEWAGETRRVDADFLRDKLGDLGNYTFLLAGPPPMVEGVVGELVDAGVPEGQLFPDRFSGY
jgi:ferredoxin-NADP reductase